MAVLIKPNIDWKVNGKDEIPIAAVVEPMTGGFDQSKVALFLRSNTYSKGELFLWNVMSHIPLVEPTRTALRETFHAHQSLFIAFVC
jgi:hypothetical protein